MAQKNAFVLFTFLYIVLLSLHHAVVSSAPFPESTARQIAVGEGPFSDDSIQPPTPSDSIPSTNNLLQEIAAWSDLSVLLALAAREEVVVEAASSEDPLLVFGPTDAAFLGVVQSFFPDTPDDVEPAEIVGLLDQLFLTLSTLADDAPSILDVLLYHIVAGDLPEEDIVNGSPLDTLFEIPLGTSGYPLAVVDQDPNQNSSRLARQIANSNGRVSFINSVLIPFNVEEFLDGAEIIRTPVRQAGEDTDPLFRPFRSLVDFASSRNDLIVLTAIVTMTPELLQVLTTSPPLHVFAPTDEAFINFVTAVVDEAFAAGILPEGGLDALGNRTELNGFASRLLPVWNSIDGLPTLGEIIAYHVLSSSSSFAELDGAGPQQTLFMSSDFTEEITIVEETVEDADSTTDSQLIASFATRNGFVSVINAVLTPFTLEVAQQAFEMSVNPDGVMITPAAVPSPRPSPSPFSEEALQPNIPDQSVDSTYDLLRELSSWNDTSVLVTLMSGTDLQDAALSPDPLLVFAPTNEAFLALVRALSELPGDPTPDEIANALNDIWNTIRSSVADFPSITDVLRYHVVAGDLPEQEIVDRRSLETVLGMENRLVTRQYPRVIRDRDRADNSRRLGRQISNTNGRVSFIDSVLLPVNVTAAIESGAIMPPIEIASPTGRQGVDNVRMDELFRPLRSVITFINSRNDLVILAYLIRESESLLETLLTLSRPHVLAPADSGFLALVQEIVPEDAISLVFGIDGDLESIRDDRAEKEMFAADLNMFWRNLEGVPTLDNIVAYHILNLTRSFEELIGAGPQETLFSSDDFASEITIVEGGIQDADSGSDTPLIASFATETGFVSVIEGVLVPFTFEVGRQAVLDLLNDPSTVTTPEPSIFPATDPDTEDEGNNDNDEDDDPVCFPSTAQLQLANGTLVHMTDVEAGQDVLVGDGAVSRIFLFTHKQANIARPFARITTKNGHQVTLTASHYLYANGRLTSAKAVRLGDTLETVGGKSVVVRTEMVKLFGLYAPHTMHGDMMVDGIRVSGYSTALHPRVAHALLAPVRLFVRLTSAKEPLGGLFYEGAESLARMLPSGSHRY